MEEDEVFILPSEELGEIKPSRRVLRSSCIGTKCLCASKGLKHHHEEPSDKTHAAADKEEEGSEKDVQIIESKSFQTSSALPSSITGWTSSRSSYTAASSSSTRIVKSFSSTSTSESSRVFLQTQRPSYSASTFILPSSIGATTSSVHTSVRRESRSGGDLRGSYLSSSLKSPSHEESNFSISSYLSQQKQERSDRDSNKLAYRESSFIKDVSPDTSSFSDSLDSPRHRIFRDFDNWINSPRTGYTYAESETYGSETESKYEVPMPHMARNPIRRGPYKSLKSVSFKVKSEQKSSLFISIKRLFRKVFYEIPASFLIFDTKLLLKSPKNMIVSTLLYLWTILIVCPAKFVQPCVSNVIYLPVTMMKKFKEMFSKNEKIEVREIAENKEKPLSTISFRSLAKLRQSLALASKRYRLKKLKEKVPKVHRKRNRSHGPPTRRSRRLRGIPAEKYELPKKWKRRMKKRKNAIKTVKAEDNHLFSDVWYSFLSLFSLSSYVEDDSDSDSSDSESEYDSPVIKENSQLLRGSKPMTNKLLYPVAYILSYLRMPFDYLGSSYHRFRMSLAKRIYYYFDHEYPKNNFSDSDSEDEEEEEEDDHDDIEEFMESRYLIQDIVTYLISLARPPPISNRIKRKTSHQFVESNPKTERAKIVRHKYKGKVSGGSAQISDTEESGGEESPFTKIESPKNVSPSIRSRFRKNVSKFFTNFSKNGSPNTVEERKTPGIVLSSDEEVVSVIQVPKLYSSTKKSSVLQANKDLEKTSSLSSWLLTIILYPWNLIKSTYGASMSESKSITSADAFRNKSTTSYKNQLESSQKSIFRRIGRSTYNFIRNLGLLVGSLCIYMVLPVIHGSRKLMSLFSSVDEVDEDDLHMEFSEDEYNDEGFDSLSDGELEKKVLDSNMKLFSSQMISVQGKSKRKSGCRRLAPFLLLLLLVPVLFYGLWPLISDNSEEASITPMNWIATKSHDYLNGVKTIQNNVQEKGNYAWSYLKNGLGTFVSSGLPNLKNSTLSIVSNVSGGLSNYENHLMKYASDLYSKLGNLFGYLNDRFAHTSQSTWSLMQNLWQWILDMFLFCFESLKEITLKTGALVVQGGESVKNKAMLVPLFFSTQWGRVGSWLSSESRRVQNKEGLSPTPTLKKESHTQIKSNLLSSADYDIIVEKIISNGKFQELAKQGSFSESENDEMIKSSKSEFIKIVNDQEEKLQKDYNELKDLLLKQKESLDSHQESYESWKKDIDNIFQNLKMEIEGLSEKTEDDKGSMHLLKELQDKIVALEEKSLKLFNLSSTCCESISSLDIQSRVKDYFSDSKGEELLLWMKERFISKDENSNRLSNLKKDIMSQLNSLQASSEGSSPLPIESVHRVVQDALIRYDADKTGKFDYALESAGGSVISTRCTETYVKKTALYTLLGLPLWYPSNNPRTAIQPGVHPGECWAFKGSEGYLVIHLSNAIIPQSFSIEHIPKSMSPTGNIDSAPKDFVVLGLKTEKDPEPVHLGKYSYSNSGDPLQSFDVQNPVDETFDIIELNILSNHGNVNFTCLYRFRVHGSPVHH